MVFARSAQQGTVFKHVYNPWWFPDGVYHGIWGSVTTVYRVCSVDNPPGGKYVISTLNFKTGEFEDVLIGLILTHPTYLHLG